jgi:TadE-like protein
MMGRNRVGLRQTARRMAMGAHMWMVRRTGSWTSQHGSPARRSSRGRRASRGQAIIEFTLIFPLVMFLVVGATDVSTLLNDHLDVVYAARTAARVGSILGTAPASDCAIIGAVQAALSPVRDVQLNRVDIYQAGANGLPNGTNQDIYYGNSICDSTATIVPSAQSIGWPPSVRNTNPITEDSIGVELDFTYTYQFDLLGMGTFSASDRAVMPMEVVIGSPIPA